MPAYCGRCGKKFQDTARVLNHMNQPYSSCRTYFEEVLQIAEALPNPRHLPNPLSDLANDLEANYETLDSNSEHIILPDPTSSPPPEDVLMADATDSNDSPFFAEFYPGASCTYGMGRTFTDVFDEDKFAKERSKLLYYPFASKDEWEMASFLLRSGLSMAAIDKFLKLELVSYLLNNITNDS
jgi:hypothetical protein